MTTAAPEADGATLHCVSVSVLCFKIGRITVPPAIVLAAEGFSRARSASTCDATTPALAPPPRSATSSPSVYSTCSSETDVHSLMDIDERTERYSHVNPPPSFLRSLELQGDDGNLGRLREFLCGGWRDVALGERWWEDALGGEIEARRWENMEWVRGLSLGMTGASGGGCDMSSFFPLSCKVLESV